MQIVVKIFFFLGSPLFCFIYWRNSLKQIQDLHADYELKYK
jgi:hypothetical protein